MRTLTFPLRAPLRGPQLQDAWGGAYMNYTYLSKKPQFFWKGPRARPLSNWWSGGSSVPRMERGSRDGAQEGEEEGRNRGKTSPLLSSWTLHSREIAWIISINQLLLRGILSTVYVPVVHLMHLNDCFLHLAEIKSLLSTLYWDIYGPVWLSIRISFSHRTSRHQHSHCKLFFYRTDAGKMGICSPWCHQSQALKLTGCCPKNCQNCNFNHSPCRKANYSGDTCKRTQKHKRMHWKMCTYTYMRASTLVILTAHWENISSSQSYQTAFNLFNNSILTITIITMNIGSITDIRPEWSWFHPNSRVVFLSLKLEHQVV